MYGYSSRVVAHYIETVSTGLRTHCSYIQHMFVQLSKSLPRRSVFVRPGIVCFWEGFAGLRNVLVAGFALMVTLQ